MSKRKDEPNYMKMYRDKILKPKQQERDTNQQGWTAASREGFYSSKEWIAIRDIRRELSPLCVECLKRGFIRPLKYIDHIIPIDERPDLALEIDNTQSLCDFHHKLKTAQDKKRKRKEKLIEKGKKLMKDLET